MTAADNSIGQAIVVPPSLTGVGEPRQGCYAALKPGFVRAQLQPGKRICSRSEASAAASPFLAMWPSRGADADVPGPDRAASSIIISKLWRVAMEWGAAKASFSALGARSCGCCTRA
jgi:hypothetical protein